MAFGLQSWTQHNLQGSKYVQPRWSMKREFQFGFVSILIGLLTVAACYSAWLNFQKEKEYVAPYDGVWWVEQQKSADNTLSMQAKRVDAGGPGEKAGIKVGDELVAVGGTPVTNSATLIRKLYKAGVWSAVGYSLLRHDVPVEASVILAPADRSLNNGLRLIALVYLGIGLYVLFRRWTAPKSTHFYVFCLISFVLYSFHYTGKLNAFDQTIYWSSIVAWLLQPALFLHFALTFPKPRKFLRRYPWAISMAYLPGAVLLGMQVVAISLFEFTESLRWNLDRLQMVYQTLYFAAAAVILWRTYRKASTPLQQQQLKWISRGTVLAIGPYTLFYVIPYIAGALPTPAMKISVLSLVFLPVTWGYAIVRYRLMDVDIIFKRGVAYTLATAAIVVAYFVGIGSLAGSITTKYPGTGTFGLIAV